MKPESSELLIVLKDNPALQDHFRALMNGDKDIEVRVRGSVKEMDNLRLLINVDGCKLEKSPENRAKPPPATEVLGEDGKVQKTKAGPEAAIVTNVPPPSISAGTTDVSTLRPAMLLK